MDVADVEAVPIRRELEEPIANAQKWISAREYCLVRVTLDDGTVGWGECWGPVAGNREILEDRVAPALEGEDVRDVARLHDDLHFDLRAAYHSTVPAGVVSGVDIALWDAYGKAVGQSVSRLLAERRRDEVRAYATGGFFRDVGDFDELRDVVVSEAVGHVDAGFDAVKQKIGLARHFDWGIDEDVALVRAVREAVGDDVRLMADANHAYDYADAEEVAHRLADLDVHFFEEPVRPQHVDSYARLNDAAAVSLAGGECWAFQHEFDRVIDAGAVDYVQPDVTSAGGITSTARVASAADAAGIQCVPHVFGSAIALAASLQAIATVPGAPMLEFDRTPNPIREGIVETPVTNDGNAVPIPDRPGIGVEVDPDALAEFRI
ncbi:MAG: mandelate racemase/muconate lactonizing enzyme family protein [Halobacteriaceae archaeon]